MLHCPFAKGKVVKKDRKSTEKLKKGRKYKFKPSIISI
jgi:hypothetical protein